MSKKKYNELSSKVVDLVGSKANVISFQHCMTRLRFNVKDKGLVKKEEIDKIEGVVGTQWSNNQLQIIIGQSVGDAYNQICEENGFQKAASIDEKVDDDKKKFSVAAVFDGITGCIIPLIPLFMASGLLKVIIVLGGLAGLLPADGSTTQVLTMASDAALYFMPILVGFTAAKKFGADPSLAMGLCGLLVYPQFVELIGGEAGATIFKLPIYNATYSNMIFPSILVVFVLSRVEKFFRKYVPEILKVMLVPLLTVIVMLPLALCVLAPLGAVIGSGITVAVEFIYGKVGFLGVGILAAIYPLLIITGMHSTLAPVCISYFTKLQYDPLIVPACYIANFNQAAASFAVAVKSKNKAVKGIASSSSLTAFLAGVTEPALFGVSLRYKTPLIASVIGGLVAGCYAGLMGTKVVAMSGLGVFALAGFLSDNVMNLVNYLIAIALGMLVTFVITLITFKEKKEA